MRFEEADLFRELATRFDEALAREEDRAAQDLARSLARGRDMRSLISAGGLLVLPTGQRETVISLGVDYCVCGPGSRWLVPLAAAELIVRSGRRPQGTAERLIPALRRLSLRRPEAEVFGVTGRRTGVLVGAGPDHLQIGVTDGVLAFPVGSVRALRLVHGG